MSRKRSEARGGIGHCPPAGNADGTVSAMTSTTGGSVGADIREGAPSTDDPGIVDERSAGGVAEMPRESSRWFVSAAIVGAVGLFVLHVVQVAQVHSPVIFYDEGGYLGNARYMVSGYGRNGAGYYAGYSLFLVPAAFFTNAATAFFHAVLLTNALLSVVTALLALLLTRELDPRAPRWVSLVVAGIVAFCPFVFTFVGLAMSENALIPTVLLTAILVARAARTGLRSARYGVVAASAFAFWITPRGLIVAGAGLIVLALLAFEHDRRWRGFAPEVVAMVLALGAGQLFEDVVRGTGTVRGVSDRQSGLFTALVHPSAWREWLAAIFGRFAYLGVASAGFVLVGIVVASMWVAPRRGRSESELASVRRGVSVFALVALLGTVISDAGAVAGVPHLARLDYLYYGRYAEGVSMPMLVIGASWLLTTACKARRMAVRRMLAPALLTGSAIAVMTVLARLVASYRPLDSTLNPVNVLGLFAIHAQLDVATVTKQLLVGAVIVAVMLLLVSYRVRVFALVPVLVLGGASLVAHDRYLRPGARVRATQGVLAHAIETLGANGVPTSCVGIDTGAPNLSFWRLGNYEFLQPKTRFVGLNKGAAADCHALVISTEMVWGATHRSARLVSVENDAPMSLWVDLDELSPAVRDRLTRAGLYFPGSPCVALPADAYRASLDVSMAHNASPVDLSALRLSVDVTREGRGSPWLGMHALARADGCGRVGVDATVEDETGVVVYKRVIDTPRSLLPGEAWHLHSALTDRAVAAPRLAPGHSYRLVLRLVQQSVRYFGGADGRGVTVPLGSPR
jgi:hypothetical protein